MSGASIANIRPLGFPWQPRDPFLFCVHHVDAYPAGNQRLGPAASLDGRQLGQDFAGIDGSRMYHGLEVPGFPGHPHRGFETVTVVRRGFIDHADSLGAAARYGAGDVQWLTTGQGIVHAEMFPLLDPDAPNPVELFQIWLNLPRASKLVAPHFSMFWRAAIPTWSTKDDAGRQASVRLVAGQIGDQRAPAPPPDSWASVAEAELAIWTIALEPGARWTLPGVNSGVHRDLFFFKGRDLRVDGEVVAANHGIELRGGAPVQLENGAEPSELLLLQGRPIGEPVVQHGPFVMNSRAEIQQAFADYHDTRFGGWPWPDEAPVHARTQGRFARHADGRVEQASD